MFQEKGVREIFCFKGKGFQYRTCNQSCWFIFVLNRFIVSGTLVTLVTVSSYFLSKCTANSSFVFTSTSSLSYNFTVDLWPVSLLLFIRDWCLKNHFWFYAAQCLIYLLVKALIVWLLIFNTFLKNFALCFSASIQKKKEGGTVFCGHVAQRYKGQELQILISFFITINTIITVIIIPSLLTSMCSGIPICPIS